MVFHLRGVFIFFSVLNTQVQVPLVQVPLVGWGVEKVRKREEKSRGEREGRREEEGERTPLVAVTGTLPRHVSPRII